MHMHCTLLVGRTYFFQKLFSFLHGSVQLTYLEACPNKKCLVTKHHQTLFGDQKKMLMLRWVAKQLEHVSSNIG